MRGVPPGDPPPPEPNKPSGIEGKRDPCSGWVHTGIADAEALQQWLRYALHLCAHLLGYVALAVHTSGHQIVVCVRPCAGGKGCNGSNEQAPVSELKQRTKIFVRGKPEFVSSAINGCCVLFGPGTECATREQGFVRNVPKRDWREK